MASTVLDDYPSLVRKMEALRERVSKAEGAFETITAQMKKRWGVSTLDEAAKLLEKKKARELETYSRYVSERKKFDKQYGQLLEGLDDV